MEYNWSKRTKAEESRRGAPPAHWASPNIEEIVQSGPESKFRSMQRHSAASCCPTPSPKSCSTLTKGGRITIVPECSRESLIKSKSAQLMHSGEPSPGMRLLLQARWCMSKERKKYGKWDNSCSTEFKKQVLPEFLNFAPCRAARGPSMAPDKPGEDAAPPRASGAETAHAAVALNPSGARRALATAAALPPAPEKAVPLAAKGAAEALAAPPLPWAASTPAAANPIASKRGRERFFLLKAMAPIQAASPGSSPGTCPTPTCSTTTPPSTPVGAA